MKKRNHCAFTMKEKITFDQKADTAGCRQTEEHSLWLSWKFPSRAQFFLWQRLMPGAFWVLLSLYNNNSTSCSWLVVQRDTTGRISIPAPAGADFMATSMRIDSFHQSTSSSCIHRCHSYSYLETLLNFSLRNILQHWILKADYASHKKVFLYIFNLLLFEFHPVSAHSQIKVNGSVVYN